MAEIQLYQVLNEAWMQRALLSTISWQQVL